MPVISVATFVFQNADSLNSCTLLAEAIECDNVKGTVCPQTVLQFYLNVADSSFSALKHQMTENDVPSMNTQITFSVGPMLAYVGPMLAYVGTMLAYQNMLLGYCAALGYKQYFTEEQWQKKSAC